jgi:hypothetical protein
VLVNFRGEGKWYRGWVSSVRADGRVDVEYEDGDTEKGVLPNFVVREGENVGGRRRL